MSRYLEFTAHSFHTMFSLGAPVHDGKLPNRFREVQGVRVDGEPVTFTDAATADRLHQALIASKQLQRRGIAFNCVTFAALMHGIPLRDAAHNPFSSIDPRIDCAAGGSYASAVVLGVPSRTAPDGIANRHVVVSAPQRTEQSYLHKLGDAGPICLSGLQKAMDMYDCTTAHPAIPMER